MHTRKRILFVENGIGYGGAIICLRHLVRNLDRTRFEPMVLTGRSGPLYRDIANDATWRCIPDRIIDVPALRIRLDRHALPARNRPLAWGLNQILSRIDDLVNFLPSLLRTLVLMLRWKPDMVHLNNEPLCNRAALLAAWLLRIPTVAHVRGEQRGSLLMHGLFRLPNRFVTVSDWIADGVRRIGVPATKIERIYDGIELHKLDLHADGLSLRHQWGITPTAFTVGLVGLLIPWKGQPLFLEAGRSLLASNPDLVLVLVGGTPDECRDYEAGLHAQARQDPFRGRVYFAGHVQDMSAAYRALDVVVSASTTPEPLGTVVIESMTLARPLVAPAHGGALEMVEHERTGLLFEPGNAAALAAQIQRLHDSQALRATLGQAARQKALQTFSIEDHVKRIEAVFAHNLGQDIE